MVERSTQFLRYEWSQIFAKNLAKMGSKMFGGLNQKSSYIRISGIKSSNSCKDIIGRILVLAKVTKL